MPIPNADGSERRAAGHVYVAELGGGVAAAGCVQEAPPFVDTLIPATLLFARPPKNAVAYTRCVDDRSTCTSHATVGRCVYSRLQLRPLFVVLYMPPHPLAA